MTTEQMDYMDDAPRRATQPPAPADDGEYMTADDRDTFRLATLIAQSLSGGTINGTTGIPGEVLFTARLIKGQGWKQCRCQNGCCS